ncbi:MAG: tyrosine--tRNA ligase, partial [Bacteroidales bacterium]|nr:tyrosine--tRNA ligase [Bacteroidales bacterium]
ADGTKFGKTEAGNVWLDKNKTSPYAFYQYWINSSDDDARNYIRIFTLMDQKTINSIIEEHNKAPHLRLLQKTLAEDITKRVHSQDDFNMAVEASEILFGKGTTETLRKIDEATFLSIFEGVPVFEVPKDKITGTDMLSLLVEEAPVFSSKGELRRLIQGGGVSMNKDKIAGPEQKVGGEELLNGKFLLFQKGKKNYYIIKATN